VDNPSILPAHLVDGDFSTAWNSRTGELRGAWIAARIPVDAHVRSLRMTAGFTRTDAQLGDLFVMNPRIARVRVLLAGVMVTEHALDPALRTLQEIPIDGPGGDYRIEIVDVVPGSRAAWREINVSELEIWGTLAPGTAPTPSAPIVRLGTLDPPSPIEDTDCIRAMFPETKNGRVSARPDADAITQAEVIPIAEGLVVCRITHAHETRSPLEVSPGRTETAISIATTTELAPVARVPGLVAGARIVAPASTLYTFDFSTGFQGLGDGAHENTDVKVTALRLTTTETVLRAEVALEHGDSGISDSETTASMYRVTPTRFVELLRYRSTEHINREDGTRTSDDCTLVPPGPPSSTPPATLEVACTHTEVDRNNRRHPETITSRTVLARWTGARYRSD